MLPGVESVPLPVAFEKIYLSNGIVKIENKPFSRRFPPAKVLKNKTDIIKSVPS